MASIVQLESGKTKTILMPVTPSTVFAQDSLVMFSSGKLVPYTVEVAAVGIEGIIRQAIAATDADYANDRLVPIEVPMERLNLYKLDVSTSTIAATNVGTEYDLTDAVSVDAGGSDEAVVKLVRYLSTTSGLFYIKFNGSY